MNAPESCGRHWRHWVARDTLSRVRARRYNRNMYEEPNPYEAEHAIDDAVGCTENRMGAVGLAMAVAAVVSLFFVSAFITFTQDS